MQLPRALTLPPPSSTRPAAPLLCSVLLGRGVSLGRLLEYRAYEQSPYGIFGTPVRLGQQRRGKNTTSAGDNGAQAKSGEVLPLLPKSIHIGGQRISSKDPLVLDICEKENSLGTAVFRQRPNGAFMITEGMTAEEKNRCIQNRPLHLAVGIPTSSLSDLTAGMTNCHVETSLCRAAVTPDLNTIAMLGVPEFQFARPALPEAWTEGKEEDDI